MILRNGHRLWLLTLLIFFPYQALAVSGNEWQGMNKLERTFFILGFNDGIEFALGAMQGAKQQSSPSYKMLDTVSRCQDERKMTIGQALAIVEKYVRENPEEWHNPMGALAFRALLNACKKGR